MHGKLKKEGNYELFQTTKGHEILTLDQQDWYAVVETSQGHILVKSDADHKKDKTVDKGAYYLADFEDDPEFKDMPHLFLKDGKKYKEFVIPQGMPTEGDTRKKVIMPDEEIKEGKVEYHVKGSGNKGSEKQYQDDEDQSKDKDKNKNQHKGDGKGHKQDLAQMSKDELYEKAKEQGIEGRSKMNKEELINHLR
ncbi:Rho termination factor-like protein [Pontibacter ummariensis]|uniref:Rho termination factor, N-terminal domain n=1 Tax=Pontibacter ummariensis TaxID=1610492 RepID=A0A239I9W8_9BACT|nr:Rho termination factor N-terminal domain-containing protein [Pontibacter ummariensis]PRY09968.1 Rho termination factor-like protein [Pontibacter ummariensis]SNS90311.1 Rho termination factor, N-terminal domain [Pontibacter ummariensis]